jgi:isoleucyl-tRNA synthetase
MLDSIKQVQWVPGYGENRIKGMVEVRPDWCLSRQRLWGVPIPVVYCQKCKEPVLNEKLVHRISELFKEHGSDVWFEKTAAEIAGTDTKCEHCGGTEFKKEEDILDVWFDSGVSHEAVLASGNYPNLRWPADMYLEGSDQHRGWFQTSLIPAVALRKAAPYKTVLTHGFVVDGEGKKMSKSLGNVILPQEIISKYGADILRLWVATSDYREDIRISPEILKGQVDAYRKIRNTLRFLMGNTFDYAPQKNAVAYEKMREIDRHALHRLQEVIAEVTTAQETQEFHKAAVAISTFCTVYLSGFYLDALKDTLYCDAPDSYTRRSAQTALWEINSTLVRMLAPLLSFTAEEAWQEMRKKDATLADSVFLAQWPATDKQRMLDEKTQAKWNALFELREKAGLQFEQLRKDKKIGSNLEAHLDLNDAVCALTDKGIDMQRAEDKDMVAMAVGTWDLSAGSCDSELSAKKSDHVKCERCWRHKDDVSTSNEFSGALCGRCVTALKSAGVTK